MINIKQYLDRNVDQSALRQVVSLLFEKIGSGVADIDPLDRESFHATGWPNKGPSTFLTRSENKPEVRPHTD